MEKININASTPFKHNPYKIKDKNVIDLVEQKDGSFAMDKSTSIKNKTKMATMLAASMLALASMGKADVNMQKTPDKELSYIIDPKDLSYDSDDEFEKDYFQKYVDGYKDMKSYARVDRNTLRFVNEMDEVVEHVLDNHVHDVRVLGYAINGDLYPDKDKPLVKQKYYDEQTYEVKKKEREEKAMSDCLYTGLFLSSLALLILAHRYGSLIQESHAQQESKKTK